MNVKRFWGLVALVFACLLALFGIVQALGLPLLADPSPWLRQAGAPAAFLGVGLLVADLVLPVPSSLVMVAMGTLFGWALGALISFAGSLGAAFLGFAVGRHSAPLMARLVHESERQRAGDLLRRWGALAIMVTRPVPLLADTVVILAGASPLAWSRAVLAATLGSLPPAPLYAAAGATAASLGNTIVVFGVVLLVAGLFTTGHFCVRLTHGMLKLLPQNRSIP